MFQQAAETWWAWTAAMSVQVAVLVAIVAVLDRLLRPWAWPQLRAALWSLVLVKLVVPPTLSSPLSRAGLGLETGEPRIATQSVDLPLIAFSIWLTGILLCTLALVLRYRRLRREWLGCRAQPAGGELVETVERVARRLSLAGRPRVLVLPK